MRVAAIYDVHGNLPALEAVLEEIGRAGADRLVVGGDVVPGPMPVESIERLRAVELPIDCIRGNGERETLAARGGEVSESVPEAARDALCWTGHELADEHAAWLASWPVTLRLDIPGLGEVLFCHATPESDRAIFTRRTPETSLLPIFDRAGAEVVVCGHTHMPFDRVVGTTRVVNAGSVGMPFGEPGADWLLLGPGIEPRHTVYDLEAAAQKIRATAYPQAAAFARDHVLAPPSRAKMLELFATAELGGAEEAR